MKSMCFSRGHGQSSSLTRWLQTSPLRSAQVIHHHKSLPNNYHWLALSYEWILLTLCCQLKESLSCISFSKVLLLTYFLSYECWQVLYTSETQWQTLFICVSFSDNICSNVLLEGESFHWMKYSPKWQKYTKIYLKLFLLLIHLIMMKV